MLSVIAIVAAVAIPRLLSARLRSNEETALTTIRSIADAQTRFKSTSLIDLDQDGVGEFGYFKELSAGSCVRATANGSKRGAFAAPSALPAAFAAVDEHGEFERSGYRFRIFLPGADGVGVGETPRFPLDADVDAGLAAAAWCCYAWPATHGTSGNRTFFVNQESRVVATDCDEYTGPGRFTSKDCGSAFGAGAGGLVVDHRRGRRGIARA